MCREAPNGMTQIENALNLKCMIHNNLYQGFEVDFSLLPRSTIGLGVPQVSLNK